MKIGILFIVQLLFTLYCTAQQDTIRVEPIDLGKLEENPVALKNAHVIVWNAAINKVRSECNYVDGMKSGIQLVYNNNKSVMSETTYKNGKKDGTKIVNYIDGLIERKEIFKEDNFVSGKCYNRKGEEIPYFTEPFSYVERMPSTGYDLKHYLFKNVKYPQSAKVAGIEGRVMVVFVVKDDGTILNAYVAKSLEPACDAEAVRVVMNMPAWQPGSKDGKNVNVYFTLPIDFK